MQEASRSAPYTDPSRFPPAMLITPMFSRHGRKPDNSCQRLRSAIEAMPRASREAMLRGIDGNTIIVGAYVDPRSGGICPMLAAHRNGGRTDLASFARSWDRYTDARRSRPATKREVLTLRSLLELSLITEAGPSDSLAASARRIRAERAEVAQLEPTAPAPVEPVGPVEPAGMRIRIRRLRRRHERENREPASIS